MKGGMGTGVHIDLTTRHEILHRWMGSLIMGIASLKVMAFQRSWSKGEDSAGVDAGSK